MRADRILAALSVALVSICSGDSACDAEQVSALQARHGHDILATAEQARQQKTKGKKQESAALAGGCDVSVPAQFSDFVEDCKAHVLACYDESGNLQGSMKSCADNWCCASADPDKCVDTIDVFCEDNFGEDNRDDEAEFVATRYCERLWTIWCPADCRVGVVQGTVPKGTHCDASCVTLLQTAALSEKTPDGNVSLLQDMTGNLARRGSAQEGGKMEDTSETHSGAFESALSGKCV